MTAAGSFLGRAADQLAGLPTGAAAVRARSLAEHAGPLDLACQLNPKLRRTPALELLSDELEQAITTPGSRLILSMGPQLGKSTLARAAVLRALQLDPDRRCLFASYSTDLARVSSLAIRQQIETFGSEAVDDATGLRTPDLLGLAVSDDQAAAGGWRLRGHEGGCIARGVGAGLTGRPVDLAVLDDTLKDARDADSETIIRRLHEWYTQVAETRLSPGASIVVIGTRWAELDLSGWLLANDETGEWRHVNIPALSDPKIPDALGRPPGVWLVSARGHTPEQWQAVRKRVGERAFHALYQGVPSPPGGTIFKEEWFDLWRVDEAPEDCLPPWIVVDPADNTGSGDECGILLAAAHLPTERVFVLDDLSCATTVPRWARLALLTAVRRGAPTLAYEVSLSQLPTRIREAWSILYTQARALEVVGGDRAAALDRLVGPDESEAMRKLVQGQLAELTDEDMAGILRIGGSGPRLQPITPVGSKEHRMQLVAPMVETGRLVMVGRFPALEHQAVTWQPGRDSPDRADALAHCAVLAQVPRPRLRWM